MKASTTGDEATLVGPSLEGPGRASDGFGEDATLVGTEPSPRRAEPSIVQGSIIGRYVVLGRLGAGGMGVVHAAYDPELDRKVAIKLLLTAPGGSDSSEGRTRLIREAQALAKLSHPHVVAVYDVGTVGERVWMAMELVEGDTLGKWLERGRPWREVLRVMTAAGEGLAAAHEAGLLHRDFKPDNVMIDGSGRVRVMDFGLARARVEGGGERTISGLVRRLEPVALSQAVTGVGALMGTPGYISPEQLAGQPADPHSDQYAFGVSLWQALYGRRPFVAETFPELAALVLEGEIGRPPAGVRVPAWLRKVVERALARDPQQRFASVRALLGALAHGHGRARLHTVLAGIGVALGVGAGALGLHQWQRAEQLVACEAKGAVLGATWNDEARVQLREAFAATEVRYAAITADKAIPWIDREAAAWQDHQTQACRSATLEGRWDPDTYDRAHWCLEERRLGLESLVRVLTDADAGIVQRAVQAAAGLPSSAACLDEAVLARAPAPPGAELRPRIAAVRAELEQARALLLAGRAKAALVVVEGVREETTALAWGPLSAKVFGLEATVLASTGAYAEAERVGIEAYLTAVEASAWSDAAHSAQGLTYLVGYSQARPAEGRLWAEHARVAAGLAGDPLGLHEAVRSNQLATIAFNTGAHAEALPLYQRGIEIQSAAVGRVHPSIGRALSNLALAEWAMGANEAAKRDFEEALAILEETLGPEHPDLAVLTSNIGSFYYELGELSQAKERYEAALAIQSAALPADHPDVAASLDNLALVASAMGDPEQALALQLRALASWKRAVGVDHPSVAVSLGILAEIHLAQRRQREALAAFEGAVEIYDHHEGVQPGELDARFGLARLLVETGGDRARALGQARLARDGYAALGEGKAAALAAAEAWIAEASALGP